jgi:hypothetical protein
MSHTTEDATTPASSKPLSVFSQTLRALPKWLHWGAIATVGLAVLIWLLLIGYTASAHRKMTQFPKIKGAWISGTVFSLLILVAVGLFFYRIGTLSLDAKTPKSNQTRLSRVLYVSMGAGGACIVASLVIIGVVLHFSNLPTTSATGKKS